MRIPIDNVVPNPFRDFEIDPIDQKQVDRLKASIEDLGFFSGCTARKRGDGKFELACGHHRYEAAKQAEMDYIEAVVDTYNDNEMRRIMAIENLTQRGAHTGAMTDAVQAFAYQVAYEVLSDRNPGLKNPQDSNQLIAARRRAVLEDGPGKRLIYQVINGFHFDEAKDRNEADEKAEMISTRDVQFAVQTLKDSGRMANIVAKAYAVVEAERAEDAAKAAEVEAKAKAKAEEAERKAAEEVARRQQAEAEATRRAEEQRKASEVARVAAEKASAEQKAEAERKAVEAKAAAEKAQDEREASAASRRKAETDAAASRKVEFDRQAAILKEAEARQKKEADERVRVQAQLAMEKIYDIRCTDMFPDPDYAETFRKTITSRGAREVITREEQYAVAQAIVEQAAQWKKFNNHKVGTEFIGQFINEMILDANANRRKEEAAREAALRAAKARMRVNKLWETVKHHAFGMQTAMQELVRENKEWDRAQDGDFPVNPDITNAFGILQKLETMMKMMFGGRFGIPTMEAETDPAIKRIAMGGNK